MLQIIKINWISHLAQEAEVLISDGDFHIVCFSQPFTGSYNDDVPQPLYVLDANEINRIDGMQIFSIKRENNTFGYRLAGKVIDNLKGIIKIGDIILELDVPLPSDIAIDDYISFRCDRIDMY